MRDPVLLISLIFLVCYLTQKAYSQQLIISIPNADITHKGEFTFTGESQLKVKDGSGTENFMFATYGIGHDTELALSAYNIKLPGRSTNFSIAPGFKISKQILRKRFTEREVKITGGQMIPISLNGDGVGSWTYGHISFRLPALKTRLTAGVNGGTRQLFGRDQVSFIAGIEQPITKKLMFVADWVSGTHDFAALAAGLQYNLNPNTALVLAYKIPNNRQSGSEAVIFELVKHFR